MVTLLLAASLLALDEEKAKGNRVIGTPPFDGGVPMTAFRGQYQLN